MDRNRWTEVSRIYQAARALDAATDANACCAPNAATTSRCEEVESLLAKTRVPWTFLDGTAARPAAPRPEAS